MAVGQGEVGEGLVVRGLTPPAPQPGGGPGGLLGKGGQAVGLPRGFTGELSEAGAAGRRALRAGLVFVWLRLESESQAL